jgi:hypothetical protein
MAYFRSNQNYVRKIWRVITGQRKSGRIISLTCAFCDCINCRRRGVRLLRKLCGSTSGDMLRFTICGSFALRRKSDDVSSLIVGIFTSGSLKPAVGRTTDCLESRPLLSRSIMLQMSTWCGLIYLVLINYLHVLFVALVLRSVLNICTIHR